MAVSFRNILSVILLTIILTTYAHAQNLDTIIMQQGSIVVDACAHPYGVVFDDGGPDSNYSDNFSGSLVIRSAPGETITIQGSYNTERNFDKLIIYDGENANRVQILTVMSGTGTIPATTCYSGAVTIVFSSDASINRPGFSIEYSSTSSTLGCINKPYGLTISNVTTTSAHIAWQADNPASTFVLTLGDNTYTISDTSLDVMGLSTGTNYQVQLSDIADTGTFCCHAYIRFYTHCSIPHHLQYDNLSAANVTCSYGTYSNPYASIGIVDFGSLDARSRHTVHYDITETDLRTADQLHCVPNGYCSSVRLGNWQTGGEAESISYTFTIDTTVYDMLLLKYAAVMEEPSHTVTEQPKFEFNLYDADGNTVNECYNATFVSSTELGWNYGINNTILWKDWTTVGVDLTPMHGQTITIMLSTYDCSHSGHYGYAYFVLDLDNKTMLTDACSTVENTFRAPDGFNYQWYRMGQEDDILSNADTLHVTSEGIYQCRLSFIGAPNDSAHANCYFTMNAFAGIRYPYAQFLPVGIDTNHNCAVRQFRFINNSYVTTDPEHTHRLQDRCESYLWVFDDSVTTTDINPFHNFTPGMHNVTLYAMLASGECSDSLTITVDAGAYCYSYDTTYASICHDDSIVFYDTVYRTSGSFDRIVLNPVTQIMEVHTLILSVGYSATFDIDTFTVQNNLPYQYHGMEFMDDTDTSFLFPAERPACDTIVSFHLKVWPNLSETILHYICEGELPYTEGGFTFYHDSTATTSYAGIHGEDSLVTYSIHVVPSTDTIIYDTIVDIQLPWYVWDTVFNDSVDDYILVTTNEAGCDSTIHYYLHIFWNGDHCDTTLEYYNVVTPNGDGKNDRFVIGGLIENNCFKYNELVIYNRDGRQVYRAVNIYDESQWWDPNEGRCPDGSYFYYFRAHGVNIRTQHRGVIEVMRNK